MDPLAHTLFGAALAESGLKNRSRCATPTLLIGANLPDIDVVTGLWGSDFELYMRRGITHGVLAVLVLPLLLTAGVLLWHRWRGRAPPDPAAPPFRPRAILALAFIAILSHPLLDWLNTYGVRLLMPFDGRWFYGDALFIVDPWFWLLTAAGVVLANSRGWGSIVGWAVLAAVASLLIVGTGLVPAGAKILWFTIVALIAALRLIRPAWASSTTVARGGLAVVVLYVGVAYGLARVAEAAALKSFPAATEAQANPSPATPRSHRVVVVERDKYRIIAEDGSIHELERAAPDAIVQRALASKSIRGFANWTRFPYWTVEEAADHWTVSFQDLRYQGPDVPNARGIGVARVDVPKD